MNSPVLAPSPVPTVYEQMVSRGVSRRDFMKFCAWMGAYLGLENGGIAQIARALHDGYAAQNKRNWATADYGGN